jgi:hypothetical protein
MPRRPRRPRRRGGGPAKRATGVAAGASSQGRVLKLDVVARPSDGRKCDPERRPSGAEVAPGQAGHARHRGRGGFCGRGAEAGWTHGRPSAGFSRDATGTLSARATLSLPWRCTTRDVDGHLRRRRGWAPVARHLGASGLSQTTTTDEDGHFRSSSSPRERSAGGRRPCDMDCGRQPLGVVAAGPQVGLTSEVGALETASSTAGRVPGGSAPGWDWAACHTCGRYPWNEQRVRI